MKNIIKRTVAIKLKSDFVVRLRSVGKNRPEIEKLITFLDASISNVNDVAKLNANN